MSEDKKYHEQYEPPNIRGFSAFDLDRLESELAAVTKQRDEAVNNYETAVLRVHYIAEQRDRLAEAVRKHRDELELTSGDSVDRILWNTLAAVEGGQQ